MAQSICPIYEAILCFFFGQWSFKKKCLGDLLTSMVVAFKISHWLKLQHLHWRANFVKDFFLKKYFLPMRALEFITGHNSLQPGLYLKLTNDNHLLLAVIERGHYTLVPNSTIFFTKIQIRQLPTAFYADLMSSRELRSFKQLLGRL